jgi:DNA-binding MarR family transcriptional regulator
MTPRDRTALRDKTIPELLAAYGVDPEDDRSSALTSLLIRRCIDLLRTASRETIEEECTRLLEFLETPAVVATLRHEPSAGYAWHALAALLDEAAQRRNAASVPALLRDHDRAPWKILNLLAEQQGPVARKLIRDVLTLSESALSHTLRRMEAASLVDRVPADNGRDVDVALRAEGREHVEASRAAAPPQTRGAGFPSLPTTDYPARRLSPT